MPSDLTKADRSALTYRHHGMRRSFWRGFNAAKAGKPASACPYEDKHDLHGHVTFSRAWRNAWLDGWIHGKDEPTDGQKEE